MLKRRHRSNCVHQVQGCFPTSFKGTAPLLIAGLNLLGVPAVQAQVAAGTAPDNAQQLREVVVTATKRDRSVRDIPETVNVISGAELEASGAKGMSDYLDRVPGVALQQNASANDAQISFRGIAPQSGGNQTVGELIGDIPVTEPVSTLSGVILDVDPFDLKDVEVLKGPQGTTFGAGGLNGALRWVLNPPAFGDWSTRMFVDHNWVVGGSNTPDYGGVVNAPIGEHAALRMLGIYHDNPGVINNLQRQDRNSDRVAEWTGRAAARWQPFDRLQVSAIYMRQQTTQYDQSLADNTEGDLVSNDRPGPSHIQIRFELESLDLRYRFDWASLVLQSSRATKDLISGIDLSNSIAGGAQGLQTLRASLQGNSESYVNELRLVSPDDRPFTWIGGIFAQDYRLGAVEQFNIPNTAALSSLSGLPLLGGLLSPLLSDKGVVVIGDNFSPLTAREEAAFGELSYHLGRHWEFSAGLRLYQTQVGALVQTYGGDNGSLTSSPLQPDQSFTQKNKGSNPKATVKFTLNDHIMAYFNAARGYQFGGINLSSAPLPTYTIPREYSSSTLWNYELGFRSNWLHRRLFFDVTPFYIDWSNAQITQTTPTTDSSYIANVGAAKSKGLEVGLAWLTPIPGVSVNLAGLYNLSATAVSLTSNGATAPAGTTMPQAPRYQTSSTIGYKHSFGGWLTNLSLLQTYESRAYSDVFHTASLYDFKSLNLNCSLGRPDLRWSPTLTFGATNLTDTRGLVGAFPQLDHTEGVYNRPRTLSLRFSADY